MVSGNGIALFACVVDLKKPSSLSTSSDDTSSLASIACLVSCVLSDQFRRLATLSSAPREKLVCIEVMIQVISTDSLSKSGIVCLHEAHRGTLNEKGWCPVIKVH